MKESLILIAGKIKQQLLNNSEFHVSHDLQLAIYNAFSVTQNMMKNVKPFTDIHAWSLVTAMLAVPISSQKVSLLLQNFEVSWLKTFLDLQSSYSL